MGDDSLMDVEVSVWSPLWSKVVVQECFELASKVRYHRVYRLTAPSLCAGVSGDMHAADLNAILRSQQLKGKLVVCAGICK